jgi:hypothetical protein
VVDHFPEAPLETAEDNTPGPNEDPGGKGDGAAGASAGPPLTKWREIWPLPLLGLGGVLFASGVYMAISTAPDPVFTPAIEDAARLIDAGEYEEAIGELNDRVYPYLGRPELNRRAEGQYRLLLARAIYGGQHGAGIPPARQRRQHRRAVSPGRDDLLGELPAGDVAEAGVARSVA